MLTLYRAWREGGSGGEDLAELQSRGQGDELTELIIVATEAVLMPCNAF